MGVVDDFLEQQSDQVRSSFQSIVDAVYRRVPDSTQILSYKLPTLTYRNKPLLSFLVAKKHLSIFPHSGWVVEQVNDRLPDFPRSKGTIRFSVDKPVGPEVIEDILSLRIEQIDQMLNSSG